MALTDDAKKQALEAARGVKDALRTEALEATTETTREMETGSPRTPGYDEHSGKTMKDAPQWPQEHGVQPNEQTEQNRDEQASAAPGSAGSNAFEQALAEKLQEATPASLDKTRDIDR